MTETAAIVHSTFTIERTVAASPSRVFQAFADIEMKSRWFTPPPGWRLEGRVADIRVGGVERHLSVPPEGPPISFEARYLDIVPDRRMIYSYAMALGQEPMSFSITTIQIEAAAEGTRLTLTEQGTYLGEGATQAPSQREEGTGWLLDALVAVVERRTD